MHARDRLLSSNEKRDNLLTIETTYGISVFIVPSDELKGSQALIERAPDRNIPPRKVMAPPIRIDSAFEDEDEDTEAEAVEDEASEAEAEDESGADETADQDEAPRDASQQQSNGEKSEGSGSKRKRRRRGRRGGGSARSKARRTATAHSMRCRASAISRSSMLTRPMRMMARETSQKTGLRT